MTTPAPATPPQRSNSLLDESWRYLIADYLTRISLFTLTLFGLCFWWTPWPDSATRHTLAILLATSIIIPILLAPAWKKRFTWIRDCLSPISFFIALTILKIPPPQPAITWITLWLSWLILENIISPPLKPLSPLRSIINNLLTQTLRILLIAALYRTTVLPSRLIDLTPIHPNLSSIQIYTGPLFVIAGLIAMLLSIILHQSLTLYRISRLKALGQKLENISSWSFDFHVIQSALHDNCPAEKGMKITEKTIIMGDIRGFTSFCERTSPETVVAILESCYAIIEETVAAHGGAKCEFIADAFLTSFTHPQKAIACAHEISKKTNTILKQYSLAIGIGITHGPTLEGIVGGRTSKKYTLIGHVVNAAARLQSEAESGEILVNQEVAKDTSPLYPFIPRGHLRLKGISQPIPVYSAQPLLAPN